PGLLDRLAAEMDDAVDAVDEPFHLRQVGQIGGDEALMLYHVGGRANVAPAQLRISAVEPRAQPRADAARRARDQNRLHALSGFHDGFAAPAGGALPISAVSF